MKLVLRWIITAFALFVAAWLVPGIRVDGSGWVVYAAMAVVLGLVNAVVRPVLKLLTCPLIVLTLGLFTLVINALTLWLSSWIAVRWLNVGFYVEDFWAALLGSVIVSVVSIALSVFVRDDDEERKRERPRT
ncbi:MAG: phage holin family protein [Anaerolineae bacterium]|nr:phage holin family protein [Anaerolineae bacterium]